MAKKQRQADAEKTRISCVMIVKNESSFIAASVTAARRFTHEVLVADTGSTDDTAAIAAAAGARVVHIPWPGSFADARNQAAALAENDLIVFLDADEVADGAPAVFKKTIARLAPGTAARVVLRNHGPNAESTWDNQALRIYDRRAYQFVGNVHETLVSPDGTPARSSLTVEAPVLTVDHHGYRDPQVVISKAHRNAELARTELADPTLPYAARGRVMVDLGRSLYAAEEYDDALPVLLDARTITSGPLHLIATDFAARLLLAAGRPQEAAPLVAELQAGGVNLSYVTFLSGQAMAQMGQPADAAVLFDVATRGPLVDASGRQLSSALAWRGLVLAHEQAGNTSAAQAALATARSRGFNLVA